MVVKCFFDRKRNCLVYEKARRGRNVEIIIEPTMSYPSPDWCPPCLAWQNLQEMKKLKKILEVEENGT